MRVAETEGTRDSAEAAALALLEYCRKESWSGYDPFDGLNSRLLSSLSLFRSRRIRLVVIQGMKRAPVNLRPLLLVPKEENPKGCALFCSSLLRLSNCGVVKEEALVVDRLKRLLELRSPRYQQYCWGYNFDWQNRGFFLPKFEPNIICTTFGGNALLDAYETYGESRFLDAAASAGEFVLHGLNSTKEEGGLCFSYTPLDRAQIHNANLLGAAFLARLSELVGRAQLRDVAEKALLFSLRRQNADGSWPYGEGSAQRWVDNFHTGYNLGALLRLGRVLGEDIVKGALSKGFEFYLNHFFTSEGLPKYYHDRLWPIDIHSVAQSIVTLCELSAFDERAPSLAAKVCQWALVNMRSEEGYFYYQKTRFYMNRIPYMRWSQAWMLHALSVFLGTMK
jgi:hypothetical protein